MKRLFRFGLPLEEKFIAATLLLVGTIMLLLFGGVLHTLSRNLAHDREAFFLITVALMIAVSVAYISLIFVQWFLLRVMVMSPIREFLAASKEIGDGDLKRRVKIDSHDEMGSLALSFNEMTGKLAGLITSLSELEQFKEEILQSMSSGVLVLSNDSRVATVNKAAECILGLRAEDCLGKLMEEIELDDGLRDLIIDALRYRKIVSRTEIAFTRNDGKKVDLGVGTSYLLEAAGWFKGIIVLFTDLTETKRLQGDLDLNRQMAALGELTAGVVHELRNPLAAISGMAELLLRDMDDQDERAKRVAHILDEVSLLDETVGRFLAFARPFELRLAEVDLREVIDRALALCSANFNGKRVHITTSFDNDAKPVRGDSEKLAQAVVNLVNNAADAVDDGGTVSISVSSARCEDTQQEETVCRITDDGPGIPEDERDKVFKPFFTQKEDGTGLGLAIVHRIVTAHSGTINLENGSDRGATFKITLPAVAAATD